MSFSVVNKLLNFQVRSYVRDFRKCLAYKRKKDCDQVYLPCVQLKLLNKTLSKWTSSSVIPFSGIQIDLAHEGCSKGLPKCEEDIDANFKKILKFILIPIRRLVVFVTPGNSNRHAYHKIIPNSCPVILFLRRLISLQDEWLEEVELISLPSIVWKELLKTGELEMPKLETLGLGFPRNSDSLVKRKILATFCKSAPNLKILRAPVDNLFLASLPESLYEGIEQFHLGEITDKRMEECVLTFARHEPRLGQLALESIPLDATNEFYESFKVVCDQLLHSSESTLEILRIEVNSDSDFFVHFHRLFSGPLTTVKSLSFTTTDYVDWFPQANNLNYSLFPAVERLSVYDPTDHDMLLWYDLRSLEPHPNPALSVTWLHLNIVCI